MRKGQIKRDYECPECKAILTETEFLLANVSGSAGTISHGGQHGDAKQQVFGQEESEEAEESYSWLP